MHAPPVASWLPPPPSLRKVSEVTEGRVRPCSGVRRRFCRSLSACASCKSVMQEGVCVCVGGGGGAPDEKHFRNRN